MRRLPKMTSPNEDCNIVRLYGTAFFRPMLLHPCRIKIAVSVYPCIVALIADVRPCQPFAGISFSGDRVPAKGNKTPRVPPCRPCAGHDAPGLLSDLTQKHERDNSSKIKRGFRQAKTGISTAQKESRNKARRLTPHISHRPATADRDFGRKQELSGALAGWQGCLRFPDSHSKSVTNPRFRADVPHIPGVTASEKIELRKIRHFEGKEAFL